MAKRYMKTVTVRKMQTKTTIRYNLTTAKMAGGFFNVAEQPFDFTLSSSTPNLDDKFITLEQEVFLSVLKPRIHKVSMRI